ncbi:uncharacterized protein [Haliotis cracherodii]|uniref:uncharacterized protein n=1 Tax=Haliotis cracherodii TaxID=6455 RepID=UPI0039E7CE3B
MGCGNSKQEIVSATSATWAIPSTEKFRLETMSPIGAGEPGDPWNSSTPRSPCVNVSPWDREVTDDLLETHTSDYKDTNPPITPPRKRKSEAVPPPAAFASIDEYVVKAPDSVQSSVAFLAQYLTRPAQNDMDKVRAFFRWIAHNIRYDTNILKRGKCGPQDAESVLRYKRAVCAGFSSLFLALCRSVRIPCKVVSGIAKGHGLDPEVRVTADTDTNHAWNIVYVNGDWRPIEVTWGAGYIGGKFKYVKQFNEFHFLTDPDDFAVKHLPYIDKNYDKSHCYQLLAKPLTIDEYAKAICPHIEGIEWGFESKTHGQVVDVDKECEIRIATKRITLQDLFSDLKDISTGKHYNEHVLLRKTPDGGFSVKVTPPITGKFELRLYGEKKGAARNKCLMTYTIRCHSVSTLVKPYPKSWGTWGLKADPETYGFKKDTCTIDLVKAKNGKAEINMMVKPCASPSFNLVHSEDKRKDLTKFLMAFIKDGMLKVKFRFPLPGYYKFSIFGPKVTGSKNEHDHLGDILIESEDSHPDMLPYPTMHFTWGLFPGATKYGFLSVPHAGDILSSDSGKICMKFKVKPNIAVSFRLEHATQKIVNLDRLLMAFVQTDTLHISARLPEVGYYKLNVFGKDITQTSKDSNDHIGHYLLSCSDPCKDLKPYPDNHGTWGIKQMARDYGFPPNIFSQSSLTTSEADVEMKLMVDPTVSTTFTLSHSEKEISDIDRYVFSSITNDTLVLKVRFPKSGFYKLAVFAKHPDADGGASYDHMGNILIESKTEVLGIKPFPTNYTAANDYGCVLLEPLCGDIPANQTTRLRMTSDSVLRIMINKEVHRKGDSNEFDVTFTAPRKGDSVSVYGSSEDSGKLCSLFKFLCV